MTIPLDVQGAANGVQLTPKFKVQVMSAKDDNGNVVDLESENIIKEIINKVNKVNLW